MFTHIPNSHAGTKKLKLKLKSTLSARVSKLRWDGGGGSYQELAATIKIDGKRNKKFRRSEHAYEAKNNEGTRMFVGCNGTGASTTNMAIQEALEAGLQDKNLGCQHIIVLTGSKNLERICNKKKSPHWREPALLTDLQFL